MVSSVVVFEGPGCESGQKVAENGDGAFDGVPEPRVCQCGRADGEAFHQIVWQLDVPDGHRHQGDAPDGNSGEHLAETILGKHVHNQNYRTGGDYRHPPLAIQRKWDEKRYRGHTY